jgi:hypothetical protein
MAPELYLQDDNYAHLYPKAVPEATGALISAVRAKLHMSSENIHP